jgi:class 3 adenylate cyclase
MERLREALESALSGRGSLVVLVGEPGIGKTRLAEEFLVHARLRGAQALAGRSYEGNVEVPYLPFVEAFRQYVRSRPDEALRSELGEGAPELATLVSEVRQRFPDIAQAPRLEGEAERLRLFESVTAFVRSAAAAGPLVLLLDDLHWADKPTLLLLRHLARDLASQRVLVLGTYRDVDLDRAHPLAEVLATLRREPVFQRVLLRGLPEADVEALVFALAEDDPDPETAAARRALAEALHRETEGNPFFIGEVLRHLAEEGKIYREGGRWRSRVTSVSELGIPEGVREVVGRRLARLSDACSRLLTIASAMPAGFSWPVLAAVSGEPEATLLDLLDEALGARLVQEREGERGGTYEFTHAIIRQTLYEELSTPRRVLLHRRIGEALESLYGERSGQHAAELAHHFFHAAPGGDVERAVRYAVAAAERATSLAAYEEAADHTERALLALDLAPSDDPARRCELLLDLARAQLLAGLGDRARETALLAAALARGLGAADRLALAALRTSWEYIPTFGPPDPERVALLEEALAALGPDQGALRARVLACLATTFASNAPERAAALSEQALAEARRAGEPEALAWAVNARHSALGGAEHIEERVALADELLRAAQQVGLTELVGTAHSSRHFDLLELGDAAGARGHLEAYERLARETRLPGMLWLATALRALWAILAGRFEEAETLAEEARARAAATNLPGGPPIYAIQIGRVRAEQGRLKEMEAVLRAVNEQTPHVGWRSRLAQIYAELGREADARREFEALAADDFAGVGHDLAWLLTIAYLAEVAAFLRDAPRAERLYQLLLPHERRNITVANAACNGPVSRPLGLLAASLGRFEDAARHFGDAIAMNERLGAPALLARVRCDHARMLLARGAPGDRERALELAQQSLAAAREMGMKVLLERALATRLEVQGVASSDTKHSIYAVASAVQRKPPDLGHQTAPDGTVTLAFSDMEGFTQLTERLGDRRAHQIVKAHNAIVREQLAAHGGYEVELQGDGFLLAFASARQALLCAIGIQRALAEHVRRNPDPPLRVRIGLHTGEAIQDADKFFGRAVIQAYRIADQARAGEILVSSLLKELVEPGGDLRFDTGRTVELKGLSGSHRVFAALWA